MIDNLAPGAHGRASRKVMQGDLAQTLGSGDLPVFATPALIALMEEAAVNAIHAYLPPDQTSVGVYMEVRHLSATPPEMTVSAEATVAAIKGRRISFEINARDEKEVIGEARHERVIVERSRFMQRVADKNK